MMVDASLCRPNECNHECVQACQRVHKGHAYIAFEDGKVSPRFINQPCTNCMSCARACLFGAISRDGRIVRERRKTRLSETEEVDNKRPYEVASYFKRFPEANMIFARTYVDPTFQHYQKGAYHSSEEVVKRQMAGYGRLELELSIATWKLYDSRYKVSDAYDVSQQASQIAKKRVIGDASLLTKQIKRVARFFGAALVGVAKLDRRWIYQTNIAGEPYEIPESVKYAIVMAVEMDYDKIAASPAFAASVATALGYSKMAFMEIELAEYIQRLGYRAIPCGNNVALSVPLAIDAGLGQYGRHGLLITKEYGPRVRIAKILTDMPLIPDKPDLGFCEAVVRFCEVCKKCADHCPSQSISHDTGRTWRGKTKSNNPGIKKWYINPETCYGFWVENGADCSNCIRSCPFNKPNNILHKMVLWMVQHMPWLDRLIVLMDDLAGFGRQVNPRTVWRKNEA